MKLALQKVKEHRAKQKSDASRDFSLEEPKSAGFKIKTSFKIPVLVKQSLDDCSSGNVSRKSIYSHKLLNLRDRTKDNLAKLKDDRSKSS